VGIHFRANGFSFDVSWHVMARALETPEFFLFFYDHRYAFYFPKRLLSPNDIEEVRRLSQSGVGKLFRAA
jgi:hypothetical protein